MKRAAKVLIWVVVFAACAGAGAYVAAHTDPFPPSVDPGARPVDGAASASSPVPREGSWLVRIGARTFHDLFVGGRCATSWRIDVGLPLSDGRIDGAGVATLHGGLRCDEETAQIQAERIDLRATGQLVDGELRFTLEETGRAPVGAQDLGGFTKTIPTLRFSLPASDGATATFDVTVPDGDRGTYGAAGRAVLRSVGD
jgi:hypothetical protein